MRRESRPKPTSASWEGVCQLSELNRRPPADCLRGGDCPACRGEYPWLAGQRGSHTAILCGRNAVQITPPERQPLSLEAMAEKLRGVGRVTVSLRKSSNVRAMLVIDSNAGLHETVVETIVSALKEKIGHG